MSNYTHRVTIACPVAHVPACNQLSGALGLSYADAFYFDEANFQDSEGNLYCVRSTACTADWLAGAESDAPLTVPEWDVETQQLNMEQAEAAKELLLVADSEAMPECIVVVVNDNPNTAVSILGLIIMQIEEI